VAAIAGIAAFLALLFPQTAAASLTVTFTKIADNEPFPLRFLFVPSVDRGTVVFRAVRVGGILPGIYRSAEGTVDVLADVSTPIPGGGGTGHFTSLGIPSLGHGSVAFQGLSFASAGNFESGIYTIIDDEIRAAANTSTIPPGGVLPFTAFGDLPSMDGDTAVFIGQTTDTP